eukprot:TRINITY_DN7612_c1_g2_i1.p1 TRINITY_DN7612_c1_g2~~TRINITY_DN7612_c1_g2_i1.p1  ORF type:complete len:496 (+),score=79.01 TRINITY_DN7612_c1_g2_i1:284-1771(+)
MEDSDETDTSLISRIIAAIHLKRSCVSHCSQKRTITFALPRNLRCDGPLQCQFRKFSTHHNDPAVLDQLTDAVCINGTKVSCPTYYRTDCKGFSWIERSARVDIGKRALYYHYYDVVSSESRPFAIRSLLQDTREDYVLVVSYYLPNLLRSNRCNQLYCIYEHPSIQKIEFYPALTGDVSFAYCLKPDRVENSTTLRLVYNHHIYSQPYPYIVEQPETSIRYAYMSICAIIRKEGPNLIEWLEYHIMMGYRRFILYDNNPDDSPDELMEEIIRSYPILVIRRKWPHLHSQTEAYTDCINRYGSRTKWMSLIDVDEFLVPIPPYQNVRDVLRLKYPRQHYLHTFWRTFGPCGDNPRAPEQLIIQICNTTTASSSSFPKSTFQPQFVAGMQNFGPHYIRLRADLDRLAVSVARNLDEDIVTYHYRYRTKPEFMERRKGPRAGRTLEWNDKLLRREWEKGMKASKPLSPQKNHILRFIPKLRANVAGRLKRLNNYKAN